MYLLEISIKFYSTSTKAPFGQLIKQKVSKKLLLLITICIIMTLHFVVWYIHHEMYARFILDRDHIDNTHVCGNAIICLHVKRQGFHHNKWSPVS